MTARPDANRRLVWRLLAVVVTMGALSWAAVPFYSWFCQVTGFAGTTQVASQGADRVLDRTVRVRFDANVMPDLGWTFRPMQTEMTVRLGETAMAYYEAVNTSDQTVTGSATYNVAPDDAGYFFEKIECFCFTEQTLAPGERRLVGTGIAIALPDGYAGFVHPRSGLAARTGLTVVNAPGTVDAGYRGEIRVCLLNTDATEPIELRRGDRIAQLVIQRVEYARFREADDLPSSVRGVGGHGSTGL